MHETADNHATAARPRQRTVRLADTYTSPTVRRHAEQVERQAAEQAADRFTMPTTAAELDAMSYADRTRVWEADPELYRRLTDATAGRAH